MHTIYLPYKYQSCCTEFSIVNNFVFQNGDWQVEETETEKKTKESDFNKENKVVVKRKNSKRKLQDKTTEEVLIKKSKSESNNKSKQIEIKKKNKDKRPVKDSLKADNHKKDKNNKNVLVKEDKVLRSGKEKNNNKQEDKIDKKKKQLDLSTENKKPKDKVLDTKDKAVNKTNKLGKDATLKSILKKHQKGLKIKDENKNKKPQLLVNKVKNYQKQVNGNGTKKDSPRKKPNMETPKKVKFVLKNNSMQGTVDYYKSVRQSPNIPFDSSKQPTKTNLKPSTPSPINPFFKKKLKKKSF